MGEVYRARDTNLKREVAVKVLPEAFSQDPDRLARFQREAEVLATLNHPNIAAVYGLEKTDGVTAIVLELVEGQTLAERIASSRTGIPLDEALAIARQIADALEAAHEKGVIHRDLKPANIKITPDGKVKVLDFGLAKMLEPTGSGGPGGLTMSPTLSVQGTFAGTILGTAFYMSPEQARGRAVDKRTDVWAFGCVLFEMLSGVRPFDGEDVAETIGAVIHKEPAWAALPETTPAIVRTVLQRCLQKDPKQRIRDIGDVQLALSGAFDSPAQPPVAAAPAAHPSRRRTTGIAGMGVAAGVALAALVGWTLWRLAPVPKVQPMRFAIVPPPTQPLALQGADRDLAFSPDGTHIVYVGVAGVQTQLMVRAIDRLEAEPVRGIVNPRVPFMSPDGRWIGFFTGPGGELKKVSIAGGPPVSLCRISGAPRGGSWGPDDIIVFATIDSSTGLLSVSAGGGEPKVLTKPDTAHGEENHYFPSLLPGGRAVLFTITAPGGTDNAQVAVLDLKTGQRKTLIRGGSQAEYVGASTASTGFLVYAAAGTLSAVRFDPVRLEVLSAAVPIVEQVMMSGTGAAEFSVSRTGALVYVPGRAANDATRSLAWVNRQGREEPIKAPLRAYHYPRLSPDGTRVALEIEDQERDIWSWDLAHETLTRLTFDPAIDGDPIWTPDGLRIIFDSSRSGARNLYWQAADGTGTAERLTTSPNAQTSYSVSPDGARVVLGETSPTGPDLMTLHLGGPSTTPGAEKRRTEPLIQTRYVENNAEISPDGHWLAYQSNESGTPEIYVRPFPDVNGGRWQISAGGGSRPVWARSGRELFYAGGGGVVAVPVQTVSAFSTGNPTKLFDWRSLTTIGGGRAWDVSRDGQKFLMVKAASDADPSSTATQASMVVVLNWIEEIRARFTAK